MTTYAEKQYDSWMKRLTSLMDEVDAPARPAWPAAAVAKHRALYQLRAEKAQHVLAMVDAYAPYDFVAGSNWDFILENWMSAPRTTCRSLAIAALTEVVHAVRCFADDKASVPKCGDTLRLGRTTQSTL